jgi:hypothetical protein
MSAATTLCRSRAGPAVATPSAERRAPVDRRGAGLPIGAPASATAGAAACDRDCRSGREPVVRRSGSRSGMRAIRCEQISSPPSGASLPRGELRACRQHGHQRGDRHRPARRRLCRIVRRTVRNEPGEPASYRARRARGSPAAMKEGLLGGTLVVSPRSESKEAVFMLHAGLESPHAAGTRGQAPGRRRGIAALPRY